MTLIDPTPTSNISGGIDYRVHGCSRICYSSDIEGTCVPTCDRLVVKIRLGMVCLGPKFEDWVDQLEAIKRK